MNVYVAPSGSIAAIEQPGSSPLYFSLPECSQLSGDVVARTYLGDGEWELVVGPDRDTLLAKAIERHALLRAVSNIELCFAPLSTALHIRLLGDTEVIGKAYPVRQDLIARLLCAPLREPELCEKTIGLALSNGFGFVSNILEAVFDLQAELRRLVSVWLELVPAEFVAFAHGKQWVWNLAVRDRVILDSLSVKSANQLKSTWARLAFKCDRTRERSAIAHVAQLMSKVLHPSGDELIGSIDDEVHDPEPPLKQAQWGIQAKAAKDRALKQVDAIVKAVAQGEDLLAEKFLDELVDTQTSFEDGETHVVKSLCNIAASCAAMFRTDFEYKCLQRAVSFNETDSWTLVQLADHFKRVGNFDKAVEVAKEAILFSNDIVALSSLADVYVQMRDYEEATRQYTSMPDWNRISGVRTALADILRKQMRLDEAQTAYEAIANEGMASDRVWAGLAEIAKRQGRLTDALDLYSRALDVEGLDDRAKHVYVLAKSNILVRDGQLELAYNLTDAAVRRHPFDRVARTLKAAIAGLLGRPRDALKDLPVMGQTKAFHEWVQGYVRGLTLMLLDRNEEARKALFAHVDKRLLDSESEAIRSLAAAAFFLRSRSGIGDAARILGQMKPLSDTFAETIRAAFAYHVAVARGNRLRIAELDDYLSRVQDNDVKYLRMQIKHRNWFAVKHLEAKILLRLAS